jgi:DNA-binding MarR family transcriptional regulator
MSSAKRRPAPDDAPLRLETFLPYRLAVLAHTVSRAIAARYEAEFGLTIPEWRVMALLGAAPGLSASQVAEATPMDKVAVSRAVRSLAAAGRLQSRADGADGRRQILTLTPAGLAVYRRIAPVAQALEAQLTAGLDARERALLGSLIDRLQGAAERL